MPLEMPPDSENYVLLALFLSSALDFSFPFLPMGTPIHRPLIYVGFPLAFGTEDFNS